MEIINCKLFLIPKPMKKHLYLILFLIGALLRVLIPYLYVKIIVKEEKFGKPLTKKYCEIINNVLSALLMGIPYFLNRIRNKDKDKNIQQQTYKTNSQKIDFINNNETNRSILMIKIIFLISTVDIICQLLIPIYYIIEKPDKIKDKDKDKNLNKKKYHLPDQSHLYCLLFFDIFARYIFSRLILKTYFYIHQTLSFILSIIGLIPITIVDILVKILPYIYSDNKYYSLLFIAIVSIQLILYSFEDIMNKVAFRALSILPYTLIFYNGLFMLGYFVIISIFFISFNLIDFHEDFSFKFTILHSLCYLPFNILRNYYLIKVIDTFSAQYMTLLRVAESIIIFCNFIIIKFIEGNNQETIKFELRIWQFIMQLIGFFFLLISTLIHNEFIIINHPKLRAKTEYYLDKDADKEQNSPINTDTCFSETITDNSLPNLYDDLTGSDIS